MMSGSAWNLSQSFCQKFPGDSSRQPCSGSRLRSFLRPGSRSVTCRQTSSRLLVPELCRRREEASAVSASTGPTHCTYGESSVNRLLDALSLPAVSKEPGDRALREMLPSIQQEDHASVQLSECTGALKPSPSWKVKCVRACKLPH